MSKKNAIEQELKSIDATKFHKLVDAYLSKKYSYNITSNGTKLGEDKPIKGTPDSFVILESGNYIFIEYTTQKSNIVNKFKVDLKKCLNENKTSIDVNSIEKIIFCCNSDLSINDIEDIKKEAINTKVEFIGASLLSNELFNHYPNISKEFLGIEIDSGQILDYDDFITIATKYSTPLNTELQFRDREQNQLIQGLENNKIIIIYGKSGVGKTKLAIEGCKNFADNNKYEFKTILNRGVDIFADLKQYFCKKENKYLVFIDDVNRVSNALNYLLEYYSDELTNNNLKIVATVRDYAVDFILNKIPSELNYQLIILNNLNDESIKEIVKKEYQITNLLYLDRIANISKGNPRLAFMAAKVAKTQNTLDALYDVSTLYDQYFSNFKEDVDTFIGDDRFLLCITIIAFFRVIDKSNQEQMNLIENMFNITTYDFWQNIEKLHNLEIIDLYDNEVAKISDQILSTYLFYKIVFIDEKIKIDSFITNFFPKYKTKFIEILNPILNSFDQKRITSSLKLPIDTLWQENISKQSIINEIIDVFWYLKQTDILLYYKDIIVGLDTDNYDVNLIDIWDNNIFGTDIILQKLSLFKNDCLNNLSIAIELMVEYANKKPCKILEVIKIFIENFIYTQDSHLYNYNKEKIVIDKLWQLTNNGSNYISSILFIRVSNEFLKVKFDNYSMKNKNEVSIINFKLIKSPELESLRNNIFEKISILFTRKKYDNDLIKLIQKLPHTDFSSETPDTIELFDSKNLLELIKVNFDSSNYSHCKTAQIFIEKLENRGINYDSYIKEQFYHELYNLEKILKLDEATISLENKKINKKNDWNKIRQIKKDRLKEYIIDYDLYSWENLLDSCIKLYSENISNKSMYTLNSNLTEMFNILANINPKLYIDVLNEYIKMGDPFSLDINLANVTHILGSEKTYNSLTNANFQNKEKWLFQFFIMLEKSDINADFTESLLKLYQEAPSDQMPTHLDYVIKYVDFNQNIILDIVKTLTKRVKVEENKSFIQILSIIFNPHTDINKLYLTNYITSNFETIKTAYMLCNDVEQYLDYDKKTLAKLITQNIDFIEEYIKNLCSRRIYQTNSPNKYEVLWQMENYSEIFTKILNVIYEHESFYFYKKDFLMTFFTHSNNEYINERIDLVLQEYIDKNFSDDEKMIFIFYLICEFNSMRRVAFVSYLLERNTSFELFNRLSLEPGSKSWQGSEIPSLQNELDFYESLLPTMTSINLLEHKQKIENNIDNLEKYMIDVKRREFMTDY
ncbi:AAA family ATPase [Francisella tularensis]|uniref:AAA family ATPase n=1 Tax=Francisella tularensis TaxID=263 RepID=UPI001319FF97|nr:AAA family ATPase [Francisella tularensis]